MTRFAPALLILLALDGVLTLAMEVLYLPTYIGAHAAPLSVMVAGVVNLALVWAAATLTDRGILIVTPLIAWTIGLVLASTKTPGGSVPLPASLNNQAMLLLACGLIPALAYLAVRRSRILLHR